MKCIALHRVGSNTPFLRPPKSPDTHARNDVSKFTRARVIVSLNSIYSKALTFLNNALQILRLRNSNIFQHSVLAFSSMSVRFYVSICKHSVQGFTRVKCTLYVKIRGFSRFGAFQSIVPNVPKNLRVEGVRFVCTLFPVCSRLFYREIGSFRDSKISKILTFTYMNILVCFLHLYLSKSEHLF